MKRFGAALAAAVLFAALWGCSPGDASSGSDPSSLSPAESVSTSQSAGEASQEGSSSESAPAGEPSAPEGCRWLSIEEAKVLTLINKERKRLGLLPLTYDAQLAAAARVRCEELYRGNYVAHTRPDGRSWETVLQEDVPVEFQYAAENLAWENHALRESPDAFRWYSLWKDSEEHYAAMTSERYTHCGVAILTGPYYDGEEQSYAAALFCSY